MRHEITALSKTAESIIDLHTKSEPIPCELLRLFEVRHKLLVMLSMKDSVEPNSSSASLLMEHIQDIKNEEMMVEHNVKKMYGDSIYSKISSRIAFISKIRDSYVNNFGNDLEQ